MFRLFKGKKVILITVSTSMPDMVEYAIAKRGKIVEHGVCKISQLSEIKRKRGVKYARVGFFSELTYIDTINLKLTNKKLLGVVLRKYINDQSIFVEEFKAKGKILDMQGTQAKVAVCAVPVNDIKTVSLIKEIFTVEYVVPVEIALYEYLKKSKIDKDSVAFVYGASVLEFEANGNFVVNRRITSRSAFSETLDELKRDETLFVNFEDVENAEGEPIHLLGLLHVNGDFDFLEMDYVHSIVSYELSKAIFVASLLFFFGMSFYGFQRYMLLRRLDFELKEKLYTLNGLKKQISLRNVSQKEIKVLFQVSKYKKLALSELDMGKFLTWITGIVPEGARIEKLNVSSSGSFNKKPAYTGAIGAKRANTIRQTVRGEFSVKLEVECSGDYVSAKKEALEFLSKLSERVQPKNSSFVYSKEDGKGYLSTAFLVEGRRF